jgi:hypothetical protein
VATQTAQTKENHARLDPAFHFFLAPLLLVLSLWCIVHAIRHPGTEAVILALLAIAGFLNAFKTRSYALKVQDRVIRLEERLRLATVLPPAAQGQCAQLTEAQLIALRFASDSELATLAERATREKLTGKQIKAAIQAWRPDYWRV